jgi:hypothetical protein
MRRDAAPPPSRLPALLREVLGDRPEAWRLVRSFWRHRRRYRRRFALLLMRVAQGRRRDDWEVRCLAALMLQHVWASLPSVEADEHAYLFRAIGLQEAPGAGGSLDDRVLEEGYTTTELGGFIVEFRRRLARRASLHADLRRRRPSAAAWRVFFQLCREECNLELARYLFSPREIVDRVVESLRVSEGEAALDRPLLVRQEAEAALARWPRFERAIAGMLATGRKVYWAGESPESRLNALASSPPGTVVVVVKPPGSRLEIEIKRTGLRDRRPLGVVFERSGKPVPRSHRLDGGSMSRSLEFEAVAASRFSAIFRAVWRSPAPISITISSKQVDTIAVEGRVVDVIDYFTDEQAFGPHFPTMRAAMARSVEAFEREWDSGLPELEGELGLTVRFLHQTSPGQSILIGTTMFRLDRLARLLGEPGADGAPGAGEGPPMPPSMVDRSAVVAMEEVLGVFHPPRVADGSRARYLEAAFAMPENRDRADRVFGSMMRQLGRFWGTLLGMRGYSHGESLVARNVGITTAWARGRWRPTLVFMDHDNLRIPAPDDDHFRPRAMLIGTREDRNYVVGDPSIRQHPFSLVDHLRLIYRVGPAVASAGNEDLRRTLARAFRRTRRVIARESPTTGLFSPGFLEEARAWDRMVNSRLASRHGDDMAGRRKVIGSRRGCGIPKELRSRFDKLIESNKCLIDQLYSASPLIPDAWIGNAARNPGDGEQTRASSDV